jgi:von Willebrand factor type A C-terminal domain/von Willebrand factor type A domain
VPNFSLECFQNEYLDAGAGYVNAIVTVTSDRGESAPAASRDTPASVVIIIDVSGSMNGQKMRQAKRATDAAIDCIPDGMHFALVAGNEVANTFFPSEGLVTASPESRQSAHRSVRKLDAGGGTRIGTWVAEAARLLAGRSGVRRAILLTDGKNESESQAQLVDSLRRASGVFECDCRGVGTDWEVSELKLIADALLGTADMVADPTQLAADFEAMIQRAAGLAVADVCLRVWIPQDAEIDFFKQVAPTVVDLPVAEAVEPRTVDFPTGAWGSESRDYHLAVRVPPGAVGDEMLAARVKVMVGGESVAQTAIRAMWTDDLALSTRINRQVAHYTGQQELAQAVQEGLEALADGDDGTARVKLGRAVQLASESGNREAEELLAKVVDVEDAPTGRVKLKPEIDKADAMMLETRSTKTVRVRK